MLTKDQILKPRPRVTRDIYVEDFGGVVRIRSLTTSERSRFEQSLQTKGKPDKAKIRTVRERLIVLSVVTENGDLMFSEADIPALSDQPAKAIEAIVNAINELNGISESDIEELEKNSAPTGADSAT